MNLAPPALRSSSLQKRGAWTHYPPAPTLKSFLVRLCTCNALLDKVRCAPSHIRPCPKLNLLAPYTDMRAHARYISVRTRLLRDSHHAQFKLNSTLTLAMQSGAFLQLVVTLTALVARLAHLSSALRRVLSTLHDECLHILSSLHVRSEEPYSCARA